MHHAGGGEGLPNVRGVGLHGGALQGGGSQEAFRTFHHPGVQAVSPGDEGQCHEEAKS